MHFKKFKSVIGKDVYINCDFIEAISTCERNDKTYTEIWTNGSNEPYCVDDNIQHVLDILKG